MKQELTAIQGLKKINIQRLKEMRQWETKKWTTEIREAIRKKTKTNRETKVTKVVAERDKK